MIFGLVHPLLDITVTVDQEYLDRYGLKANDGILAQEKHRKIYDEVLSGSMGEVKKIPGGATQNTLRVAQWYLREKHATTSVGCVGADKVGEDMIELLNSEGVRTEYMVDTTSTTGVCAVLVSPDGVDRSLVTRLDAANNYQHTHLVSARVWSAVEESRIFYVSGFMLNYSSEIMAFIGEHAVENNKCFVMNLSAPYLSSLFKVPMQRVLPYCDIIIGNNDEAMTLAENFGFSSDLYEVIEKLARLPKKNSRRKRIVIITQQEYPVLVYHDGEIKEYPVISIAPEDIADTNGAGDAFVGGFLASFARDRSLHECVQNGINAAHMILKVPGCTLPERHEK